MSADRIPPSQPAAAPDERDGATDLAAALDASACLGAWSHDPAADRLGVAAALGEALGLAPEERAGVPLARALSGLDPEDRPRVEAMLDAVRATGCPFEAEFRMRGARGTRVLRLTGRAETGIAGHARRTCGLAFDLTELRLGRGSPPLQAQWRVNRLAGHVIAMQDLVAALGNPALTRLLDRVAVETGFELARQLGQAGGEARH